jgi:5'-3' exonuclease
MGIPMFYKTIVMRHGNVVKQSTKDGCERLFLDLNCAIHTCANKVLAQFPGDFAKIERGIIDETNRYIDTIVGWVKPRSMLYVAIDGLPPRAKMLQQRNRRFVSSWRTKVLSPNSRVWDRNAITPGTKFMETLSVDIKAFLDSRFKDITVVFMDSNTEGEGEHKIFNHIRSNPITGLNVVYGLDADLIMLSLLANQEVMLLREPNECDTKSSLPFVYFDTNALKHAIQAHYEMPANDYVALCFLLGNDFIPSLSFLRIANNGIDKLVSCYKRVAAGDTLCTASALNMDFMLRMLEVMKDEEDREMVEADGMYYNQVVYGTRSPEEKLNNFPTHNKFPNIVCPRKTGWRLRYYHHLFKVSDMEEINKICSHYIEGLEWVHAYYFKNFGSSSTAFNWYYRHNYSPTVLDLYNFVYTSTSSAQRKRAEFDVTTSNETRYSTDLQLLMVLPPSSAHLVKKEYRALFTDINHGMRHLYPDNFKIGTYLKKYLWECHPCLPLIDIKRLVSAIENLRKL